MTLQVNHLKNYESKAYLKLNSIVFSSFKLYLRVASFEESVNRIRIPRQVYKDGVRPYTKKEAECMSILKVNRINFI